MGADGTPAPPTRKGPRGGRSLRAFLRDESAELGMEYLLVLCGVVVPLAPVIAAGQAVMKAYLDLVGFALALPYS